MSRYVPQVPPSDPADIPQFLAQELLNISRSLSEQDKTLNLSMSYAAPTKVFDGMIVLADGNLWKPTGAATPGVYCYYNAAWHFLG